MSHPTFSPGSTIGILGGGQLARMLCMEAKRMGYRTLVWTGGLEAPASALCDEAIELAFDDPSALAQFVAAADVATAEFENIPRTTLEQVAQGVPLRPSAHAIATCANREQEKTFLRQQNIPCAPFWIVTDAAELDAALQQLNGPGVLKTSAFGYDGKGQRKLTGQENAQEVWQEFDAPRAILEGFIHFAAELSIMIARNPAGEIRCFDPVENQHRHHILDLTIAPAPVGETTRQQAIEIATQIAQAFDYVGIMGVEFFLLADGSLLVNEMAPRPHNSGHHTIDACVTSQFEQQLRAVCGLALGSTRLLTPAVMLNLLGDMWPNVEVAPDWNTVFRDESAALHLYGKKRAMGRRKMGHATFLGNDALSRATAIKTTLIAAGRP
ncbi:MAG: 5-(carboxyamino)imidazole ribonucleotide synthase [Verrucomicrobia bacterium]|nr:MAG: 5-(carboxyamino)imidazole ribonucleotide synthase [Verrucomicrobiota bacterium]